MKEQPKLGRFVQCKCSHTCASQEQGFQWLLPRTKSKHMLFEGILQKNNQDQENVMQQLEEAFSSINLDKVTNKKIKKNASIAILNLNLKKRWIKQRQSNMLVLKEFTVICSTVPTIASDQFINEYY